MYTLIITGGIGSGKSTALACLKKLGAVSLSLDDISRELMDSNMDMKREIVDAFGPSVVDEDFNIIRPQLAYLAFATEDAVVLLNEITFPYIRQRLAELIMEPFCAPVSDSPLRVIEVPLLTEAPEFCEFADEVMVISTPWEQRLERLIQRGLDEEDACARDKLQADDQERFALADTIIYNDGSPADLEEKLNAWWRQREAQGWKVVS